MEPHRKTLQLLQPADAVRMTERWVNDIRIFISEWTFPLFVELIAWINNELKVISNNVVDLHPFWFMRMLVSFCHASALSEGHLVRHVW